MFKYNEHTMFIFKLPKTSLSSAEKQVLSLVAEGKSNKEIAMFLFRSETTVKNELSNVYRKLGCRNRVQAVLKYQEMQKCTG